MRYSFSRHPSRAGWYSVVDSQTGLVCSFEEHRFNETQEFNLDDLPIDPESIARAMRELGEWLSLHRYSETMPVPTYEYRLSEDNETVQIIRHKEPKFVITADANQDIAGIRFTNALKKTAEYLKKGIR